MNYNNKEKRTTKTVEINNTELQKCKNGERFKVDVITKSRSIIVDPPRLTVADAMKAIANLTSVVNDLATEMRIGFNSINIRLDKLETNDKEIFDILKRNNLH
jgi:hypothetical protein